MTLPPDDSARGPRLRALRGEVMVGEWVLDRSQPLRIGRSRQCDVILEGDLISRVHLEVRAIAGGGWEAVDLGSTSGTWHKKKRISRHRLRTGDRLTVGETDLYAVDVEADADAPQAPPPFPTVPPPFEPSMKPMPRKTSKTPSAPRQPASTVVWSAVALAASLAVVAGGWFVFDRLRSRGAIAPSIAGKSAQPSGYSTVAADALLKPATDGVARRTPLGSFTTTAGGGRLDHALVTLELPAGALPEGSKVTVSRVDAAPAAMRDGFPVAQWGDFTPLSPILELESGVDALGKPSTISFPLTAGARFSTLAILAWNPKTFEWDSFPARFDPKSGRAVAEMGHLGFFHLLGLVADGSNG